MRASIFAWACLVWPGNGHNFQPQQEDPSAKLAALLINGQDQAPNPLPAFAMPYRSAARPCQSPVCRHRQNAYMQLGSDDKVTDKVEASQKVKDLAKQLEMLKKEEKKQRARKKKKDKKAEFKRELAMLQRGADSGTLVRERQQEALTKSQQFQNRLQSLRNDQVKQWQKQEKSGTTKMVLGPKGFDMWSMSYRYDNAGDAFGGKIPQELLSEAWKDEFIEPFDWKPVIGGIAFAAGWLWLGLQPYGQDALDPLTYGGYSNTRDSPAEIRRRFEAAGGYLYGPEDSARMKGIGEVSKLFDADEADTR